MNNKLVTLKESSDFNEMQRVFQSTENNELWTAMLPDLTPGSEYLVVVISFERDWVSEVVKESQSIEISTKVKVNENSTFTTELPIIHDELCRLILAKKNAVIVVRKFSKEPHLDLNGNPSMWEPGVPMYKRQLMSWYLLNGELRGISESQIFAAYNTNSLTGEPLSPEPGLDYVGTSDITFNN